jgi:rare lipoprotein A
LLPLLAGIPATSVGGPVAQLIDPAPLSVPLMRVKLRIRRIELDVLDGTSAMVTGTLRLVLAGTSRSTSAGTSRSTSAGTSRSTSAGTSRSTSAGTSRSTLAGRTVELQRLGRHGWRALAHTVTGVRGRFVLRYTPHRLLSERVRVVFPGDARDRAARHNVGDLRSYRLAGASWYGGGGSLACGGQLTSYTMGVANKTLPCGTLVTLRYGGRQVSVPVVDRGPYVAGRDFDLTEATKRALRFEGVGEVWSTR